MKFIFLAIGGSMFLYCFTMLFGTLAGIATLGLMIMILGSIHLR